VSYVGFKKMHPHDSDSILRIALTEGNLGKDFVKQILGNVMNSILTEINNIKGLFDGSRSKTKA
jgi:hypothetical protein